MRSIDFYRSISPQLRDVSNPHVEMSSTESQMIVGDISDESSGRTNSERTADEIFFKETADEISTETMSIAIVGETTDRETSHNLVRERSVTDNTMDKNTKETKGEEETIFKNAAENIMGIKTSVDTLKLESPRQLRIKNSDHILKFEIKGIFRQYYWGSNIR